MSGLAARRFHALGTTVTVLTTRQGAVDEVAGVVRCHVDALDRAASRFREDSELMALNQAGGAPLKVSPLLMTALSDALWAAEVTGGLIDPSVGRALELCGYDRDFASVAPTGPRLQVRFRPVPGWRAVKLDRTTSTVTLLPGVRLDLGATAKAACADRAAADAAAMVAGSVLVNIGGDLAVAGTPPDGGWVVRIADRHDEPPEGSGPRVAIGAGGLATSGTAARRWHRGGQLLHHVIDPRTGQPAAGCWRTVSVTADTCLAANVAATSAVILGGDGPQWLSRLGFHARLEAEDGTVVRVGDWPADTDADRQAAADRGNRPGGPLPAVFAPLEAAS